MEQFMLIVGFMFGVTLLYLLIAGLIGALVYVVIRDTDNSVKLGLVFSGIITMVLLITTSEYWLLLFKPTGQMG